MDGFKNTTKTQYSMGGYATGGSAKFGKVMREFKAGTLHSGSKKGPAVTSPKQAFAIAASEARKAPMKKQAGGPVASKTGTRTDPEYGDFVAAGVAKPSAMAVKKPVPMVKKPVPMASTKKPMPRAMFGDEAAAAMDRSGKAGMTAAEKREGYNMGGKTSVDAKVDWASGFPRVGVRSGIHKTVESRASASRSGPAMRDGVVVPNASYKPSTEDISDYMRQSSTKAGRERLKRDAAGDKMLQKETLRRIRSGEDESPDAYKKGGRAKGSKGPKVMAEKMVATKRTATPTMNAQEMRTMQRYRAAMASRPRREPMIGGDMGGDQIGPAIRQMAMAPEAPPTMGMRKGGYSGMKMRKGGTPC